MSMRILAGVGRGALLVAGALVIALAVLTLGARLALPFAERWKGEIEAGLGDYLGRPVAIDSLALRWRGTGPELRARGVSVAQDARRRVSVDEALIDLDLASSVLRRSPVFDELTLVGAELVLERGDGRWSVQAMDVGGRPGGRAIPDVAPRPSPSPSGTDGLTWLFDARRVGLLDTRLALVDAATGPIVALDALDLRVENDGGTHRMRLEARLPGELGGEVEIGIDFDSGMRDAVARRASGRFHALASRVEAAAVARIVADVVGSGSGPAATKGGPSAPADVPLDAHVALELWGRLDAGRLEALRGRVEATAVRAAGEPDARAALDAVGATVRLERPEGGPDVEGGPNGRGGTGWTLVADGAALGRDAERAELDVLRLTRPAGGGALALEAGGTDLPVGLAAALPLALAGRAGDAGHLAALEPRGTLERWSVTLRAGEGLAGLDLAARAVGLATSAAGPLPGVDALDAELVLERGRGTLALAPASPDGVRVDAPRIDADRLVVDALDARLEVDLRPAGATALRVRGPIALETRGLDLSARLGLAAAPGRSPRLDLSARFALDEAAAAAGFLPDRLLAAGTVAWFETALRSGRAANGELLVSGRLADFPYEDGSGVFRASADVRDLTLDWLPGWPVARGVSGTVRVDGASVSGNVRAGRAAGLELSTGEWRIEDVRRPGLALELAGAGTLPAMLDFATNGPLAPTLEPALGDVAGVGDAGLDLAVSVPLSGAAARRDGPLAVDGTVFLAGNDVRFGRARVALEDVVGAVSFDEAGFRAHRLRGDWLGRPLVVDAATTGEGAARAARVTVRGALEAADVLAHYEIPLDGFVAGASGWRAELVAPFDASTLARTGVTLRATSDLVGTALALPPPLGKAPGRALPFALDTAFFPDVEAVRWTLRAGRAGDALVAHADTGEAGLEALALGLGGVEASVAGVPGVRIDGAVDALPLDGWAEALGALIDALPDDDGPATPVLPVSGDLSARELTLFDAPLGPARLRLNTDGAYLNAALDNEALRGNARWPRLRDGELPALVRLARVDGAVVDALIGPDEPPGEGVGEGAGGGAGEGASEPDAGPPGGPDPRELPPIRARVASLGWRAATLENLVLRTEPDVAGLRIDALGFTHADLQLLGEGYWRVADPQDTGSGPEGLQRTALSLTLQSGNFGAGLADIGLSGLLSGGAGRATARVGWPGPAWGPALGALGGALEFELDDGLVVPLDPGAGKLIGLFAFQALPRRLDLDFSDVTDDGLAFSRLTGRAGIEDGVVDASLVRLAGPVGVIDVTGTTDLVAGTLDQRVTVLPRVSAALPIIGAIAGGASAGVGALLAGGVLKAMGVDLDRIGLREFALTGPWEAPELEPL